MPSEMSNLSMAVVFGIIFCGVGVFGFVRNRGILRRVIRVEARIVGYRAMPQSDEDVFCHRAIFDFRVKGQPMQVTSRIGVTSLEIKPEGTRVAVFYDPASRTARPASGSFLIAGPIALIVVGMAFLLSAAAQA